MLPLPHAGRDSGTSRRQLLPTQSRNLPPVPWVSLDTKTGGGGAQAFIWQGVKNAPGSVMEEAGISSETSVVPTSH